MTAPRPPYRRQPDGRYTRRDILTDADHRAIRELWANRHNNGHTHRTLAAQYGVSLGTTRAVVGHRIGKHAGGPVNDTTRQHTYAPKLGPPVPKVGRGMKQAKLTIARVKQGRRLVAAGQTSAEELALRWQVSPGALSRALRGHTWAHVTDPPPLASRRRGKTLAVVLAPEDRAAAD